MLRLLQMGPSKVLTTLPIPIQSSWQLSLLELSPCRITVTPSSDSSDMYTSSVQSSPASANAALSPHLHLQTSYPHLPILHLLPMPLFHRPLLLAFLLRLHSPPGSLRVLQWNAGGLRARSTKLLHFLSSHPVDIICIQESNLNSSSPFRIPGFSALRSDRTHSRSGILSSDTTHASGDVVIFVRQGLSFSELSTSSLSSLDPYSDYVGINISLNNFSSVSFLNVNAPLFAPPQRMAEPIPSLPPFFLLQKSLHSGRLQLPSPLWDSRVTSDPRGEEVFDWVISSDLLPLNNPDTPTLLHRSSGSRSSPDISFAPLLLPFLVLGRCYRTWVLTTYQFFYLSLSLRSHAATNAPLPSIFTKLAGMALPPTLTLTDPLQRNTRLFLFPLLLLSLPLWH